MLSLVSDVLGFVGAALAGIQAYRASRLYMRARAAGEAAAEAQTEELAALLESGRARLEVEAGWKPIDHRLLVTSMLALVSSFGLSLLDRVY